MKMWIARDKDGDLWLYDHKPVRGAGVTEGIYMHDGSDICNASELNHNLFPEVTFENSPMEVELIIKK